MNWIMYTLKLLMIDKLESYILSHCKKTTDFRVGAEFEYHSLNKDFQPISFHGSGGASELLKSFLETSEWELKIDLDNAPLAVSHEKGYITLEPGCQIEFSGAPRTTIFELKEDLEFFIRSLKGLTAKTGHLFFAMGVNPLHPAETIPLLPKPRYKIMNQLFQRSGKLGHWMMRATSSQQVCLDFSSENDLMRKLYLGFLLTPFVRALFSNSPFKNGEKGEMLCFRNEIWRDTDPDRCGIPKSIFSKGATLHDYCEYVLSSPAMFQTSQGGQISSANGLSFLELYSAKEREKWNAKVEEDRFLDHLSQSFIEARIKGYIEFRTPDGQIPRFHYSPIAFYKGIFNSSKAVQEAYELLGIYPEDEIQSLLQKVSAGALRTPIRSYLVLDVVKELLKIADRGLKGESVDGPSEECFLEPLSEIVFENEYSPADFLLRMYERDCDSNLKKLIKAIEIEALL